MSYTKATFEIKHQAGQIESITICMPFRGWVSAQGQQWVSLPLLEIENTVLNDSDAMEVLRCRIAWLCESAEQQGPGIERVLQRIGWFTVQRNVEYLSMEFPVSQNETMLELEVFPTDPLIIRMHSPIKKRAYKYV